MERRTFFAPIPRTNSKFYKRNGRQYYPIHPSYRTFFDGKHFSFSIINHFCDYKKNSLNKSTKAFVKALLMCKRMNRKQQNVHNV